MAFESVSTLKKNRVYAPIITGLAILAAILIAKPAFSAYSNAQTELATVKATQEKTLAKEKKLQDVYKNAGTGSTLATQIQKINKDFVESEIMQAILLNTFTVASSVSTNAAPIVVNQVTLDKGNKLPNGIYYGKATLNLVGQSTDSIVDYLTYLTTVTPFAFTLSDITLPIDTAPTDTSKEVTTPVTLGIYYYK